MLKFFRRLSIIAFFILLVALMYPKSFLINYLFYEENPEKVDIIVLLSGDGKRMEKVAELYHSGYADKVLLTNALEEGSTIEDAEFYGIPRDALLTETEATSTYENALFSKEILLKLGYDSAIVVSSNYHMRRTKLAFKRVFHDTNLTFNYVPYQDKTITRDSWKQNASVFKREYIKLIGGYFLYSEEISPKIRMICEKVLDSQNS